MTDQINIVHVDSSVQDPRDEVDPGFRKESRSEGVLLVVRLGKSWRSFPA